MTFCIFRLKCIHVTIGEDGPAVSAVTDDRITPLARNEWICWTVTVKRAETRKQHVERTVSELLEGKRRPVAQRYNAGIAYCCSVRRITEISVALAHTISS